MDNLRKFCLPVIATLIGCSGWNRTLAAESSSAEAPMYQARMESNLKLACKWVIESGIQLYLNAGKEEVFRYLLDKLGVQLWVEPQLDSDWYVARFLVKGRGMSHEIIALHRVETDGYFYEFWVDKVTLEKWADGQRETRFFVARTVEATGTREIVAESTQFIDRYNEAGVDVAFPIGDLRLLYILEPWLFKENYQQTNLDDREVISRDGELYLKE